MKKYLSAVLFGTLAFAAMSATAQGQAAPANDMQALRNAVKADKKALVAKTLDLTPAEAKKFWPIYDAYQRALDVSNRQVALAVESLVTFDRPVSDAFGKQLANELIVADENEIKARRKMQNSLMRALPPKKAARYMQLEGKIRAFQDYDLAVAIPLIK
jgi:Spy/CpxP family protein refolding chaperone